MESNEIARLLGEAYFSDTPHEAGTLERIRKFLAGAKVFIDIGASLGQYTRFANEVMSDALILAVEADPVRAELLTANCKVWESLSNNTIRTVNAAVTDRRGPVTFFTTKSDVSGGLFVHETGDRQVDWTEVGVDGMTMDELCAGLEPDFIKMDIEGAELRALRGGERVLREGSPLLLIEIHNWPDPDGLANPGLVFELMKSSGYSSYPVERSYLFGKGKRQQIEAFARTNKHRAARLLTRSRLSNRLFPSPGGRSE